MGAKDQHERRHRKTARNAECVAMMAGADFGAVPSLAVAMGLEPEPEPEIKTMHMTSDRDGDTDTGIRVPSGTTVTYLGHVPGGMVRVRLPDGTTAVMHPHCFRNLR